MHAKSGASTFEPSSTPLDDRHVPAPTHEGGAREKAAKGTADHDRAPHAGSRSCEEETFETTMPSLIARRQAVAQVWIAPRAVYAGGALARVLTIAGPTLKLGAAASVGAMGADVQSNLPDAIMLPN